MARPTAADRRYQRLRRQKLILESGALKFACSECGAVQGQDCRGLQAGVHFARKTLADKATGRRVDG